MTRLTARIYYRAEKPYGVGRTAHERHTRIEPGFRAEVVDGLDDRTHVYTGVCATRDEARAELIGHVQRLGLTGTVRFIHA
jgi:hypothetical protein